MMDWGYGSMMGQGLGVVTTLVWLVVLIDGIFAGFWLWQNIQKKARR